jgi:hypothetical protein
MDGGYGIYFFPRRFPMANPYFVTTDENDRPVKVEMPFALKERPRCRRVIENLCKQYGCTVLNLKETLRDNYAVLVGGLRKQLKLMVYEEVMRRAENHCLSVDDLPNDPLLGISFPQEEPRSALRHAPERS